MACICRGHQVRHATLHNGTAAHDLFLLPGKQPTCTGAIKGVTSDYTTARGGCRRYAAGFGFKQRSLGCKLLLRVWP